MVLMMRFMCVLLATVRCFSCEPPSISMWLRFIVLEVGILFLTLKPMLSLKTLYQLPICSCKSFMWLEHSILSPKTLLQMPCFRFPREVMILGAIGHAFDVPRMLKCNLSHRSYLTFWRIIISICAYINLAVYAVTLTS